MVILYAIVYNRPHHEFAEVRRQLDYKAPAHEIQVVVIERFFPSSKTCHQCGWINDALTLAMRAWDCPQCGCTRDRDVNAARHIRDRAIRLAHAEKVSRLGRGYVETQKTPVDWR